MRLEDVVFDTETLHATQCDAEELDLVFLDLAAELDAAPPGDIQNPGRGQAK